MTKSFHTNMNNDLTNLLPQERQNALTRGYFLRLGIVAVLFATALILVSMIMLLPTYVFLKKNIRAKEVRLASIESALSSVDEEELSTRIATLSNNVTSLITLSDTRSVSKIIRTVLDIPRPGTVLSGFSYAPASEKNPEKLAVSGFSKTRSALRNYQLELQAAPFVLSAVLPVSAYAKDADIEFTITITTTP